MAIHVLFGPGGSGKSLYQVYIIVDQLRNTHRNICTNLALDLPALQQHFEKKYPGESVDVAKRIRILEPSEAREFWNFRGPLVWTGHEYDTRVADDTHGVCYVIDEAGALGFDAKGWATREGNSTRGERATFYLDQQRKFSDDVFVSCNGRRPATIAQPFRDKAHYFIALRNEYNAVYGVFRGRSRFTWKKYESEPNGSRSIEPIQIGHYSFDDGWQNCYHTAHGVGVAKSKADIGVKPGGISIWWAVVGAFALVSLCFVIPWLFGRVAQRALTPAESVEREQKTEIRTISPAGSEPIEPPSAAVTLLGYSSVSGRVRVRLSDGRILGEDSKLLRGYGRDWVEVEGLGRLYWQPAFERAGWVPPAPLQPIAPPVPVGLTQSNPLTPTPPPPDSVSG